MAKYGMNTWNHKFINVYGAHLSYPPAQNNEERKNEECNLNATTNGDCDNLSTFSSYQNTINLPANAKSSLLRMLTVTAVTCSALL
jgi:fluoride ion exporter CrcB/FEX